MGMYRFIADAVVVLHVSYVLFVIFGVLAVLLGMVFRWRWIRNFWFRVIHFTMIAIVALESLWGVECPLTTFEDYCRLRAGETVVEGSFVGQLAHSLTYYAWPEWVFTVLYCVVVAILLAAFVAAPPNRPGRRTGEMLSRAGDAAPG